MQVSGCSPLLYVDTDAGLMWGPPQAEYCTKGHVVIYCSANRCCKGTVQQPFLSGLRTINMFCDLDEIKVLTTVKGGGWIVCSGAGCGWQRRHYNVESGL